jgi:hypothetical protein
VSLGGGKVYRAKVFAVLAELESLELFGKSLLPLFLWFCSKAFDPAGFAF